MRVFLVRHGETDWNKERRIQGQVDIPLNAFGRMLAEKTREGLSGISFDRAYTSPLSRARETAEIILAGQSVKLVEEPLITEMDFGIYEGKHTKETMREVPEEFRLLFENPSKYKAPEQGEGFESVLARMKQFLSKLCDDKKNENRTILIVTHGAALAGMLHIIREEPLEQYWGIGVHKNCGVTELIKEGGAIRIISENRVYYKDKVEPWEAWKSEEKNNE